MRMVLLLAIAFVTGCQKPKDWVPTYPPAYFGHWSDRMKERFPELQTIFGPSCVWASLHTRSQFKLDQCFQMEKPKHWSGLWRRGLEESRFCPDGNWALGGGYGPRATECDYRTSGQDIWLDPSGALRASVGEYSLDRIEFIGRKTTYAGGPYGHMGMSNHEMIVDRMISIREVKE